MTEQIRPIYLEFQGFLKGLPEKGQISSIRDRGVWDSYHQSLEELNIITGRDYNKSKLDVRKTPSGLGEHYYVSLVDFRFKLSGIILRLYAEFFQNEKNPLDGSPSTIINNSQNQNQSLQVEIALEVSEKISEKIKEFEPGSKERKLLEEVKSGLKNGKGVVDLINSILTTGSKLGLATFEILKLFS